MVMSEKFALVAVAGECASRRRFAGDLGPTASTSYPRKDVPSAFTRRSPFFSPVPVNAQCDASSIVSAGLACVMYMTPIIASSERFTGGLRKLLVFR